MARFHGSCVPAGKQFRLEVTSFYSGTTSGAQAIVGHKLIRDILPELHVISA